MDRMASLLDLGFGGWGGECYCCRDFYFNAGNFQEVKSVVTREAS